MNEACHTYEWVMSHIWMSHVTHMNESFHTDECVMSLCDMNTSCHTHVNESCHTHVNGLCPTHVNESCHTQEVLQQQVMSHTCERVMSHTCERVMSHTCSRVMSHTGGPTTRSHVTHMCMCDSNVSCHTYERVIWTSHVTHMWTGHVTHMWTSHVSHRRSYNKKSCHTCECVIWTCHVTRVNESCHTQEFLQQHVMSRMWMCHLNESCHTKEAPYQELQHAATHFNTLKRTTKSDTTDVNELCHIREWVMSHIVWHIWVDSCHT